MPHHWRASTKRVETGAALRMENKKKKARCHAGTQLNTHKHKPIGVTSCEYPPTPPHPDPLPRLLLLMHNDTTPHKSASGSIRRGRFFFPATSPLFTFILHSPSCSFEPHHSLPFSAFPFHPRTLSIIPPSLPSPPAAPLHISVLPRQLPFPQVGFICMLQNRNAFSSFQGVSVEEQKPPKNTPAHT